MQTCCCESLDVFSIAAQVFSNLFFKICPLFGQILITCLKCSRASFPLSSYSKKMRWGRGCENSTFKIMIYLWLSWFCWIVFKIDLFWYLTKHNQAWNFISLIRYLTKEKITAHRKISKKEKKNEKVKATKNTEGLRTFFTKITVIIIWWKSGLAVAIFWKWQKSNRHWQNWQKQNSFKLWQGSIIVC